MANINNIIKHGHPYKRVLQFWSGGADSTYLVLQNLLCQNKLYLTYLDIQNNGEKPKRETTARNVLKEDISIFCDYFNLRKPIYLEDHHIKINHEIQSSGAPQQIMFAMTALLIGINYDEIQMAVVAGDSMCGSDFNKKIVEVYREHFHDDFPDITYPIQEMSKETIYLALKGYDKLLGTNFVKHITVCESVGKPCGKHKVCHPCQTQAQVLKRLKWIK